MDPNENEDDQNSKKTVSSENLVVKENKEIIRNALDFSVDRAHDGGDGRFDGGDGGSERPRVLLGVIVDIGDADERVNRHHPHEP